MIVMFCIAYFILDRRADVVALHKAQLLKRIRNPGRRHAGGRPVKDSGMFRVRGDLASCLSGLP